MSGEQDVAMISTELTAKRRVALLALTSEWRPTPRAVSRQAVASLALAHSELCEREWQDGCAQCTYYRLTPLGISVRAHLLSGEVSA